MSNDHQPPATEPKPSCLEAKLARRISASLIVAHVIGGLFILKHTPIPSIICLFLVLASLIYMGTVHCPRCGQPYFTNGWRLLAFSSRCCRCGAP